MMQLLSQGLLSCLAMEILPFRPEPPLLEHEAREASNFATALLDARSGLVEEGSVLLNDGRHADPTPPSGQVVGEDEAHRSTVSLVAAASACMQQLVLLMDDDQQTGKDMKARGSDQKLKAKSLHPTPSAQKHYVPP